MEKTSRGVEGDKRGLDGNWVEMKYAKETFQIKAEMKAFMEEWKKKRGIEDE